MTRLFIGGAARGVNACALTVAIAMAVTLASTAPAASASSFTRSSEALAAGAGGHLAKRSADPRQLARRLLVSKDVGGTRKALLDTFKELRVGVVSGSGRLVLAGARGPYLYDFELTAIVAGLRSHKVTTLSQLSQELTAASQKEGGRAIGAGELLSVLRAGTRRALRAPSARGMFAGLLARELGLRHAKRYDLARVRSPDAVGLDAVQHLLVLADLAAPGRARSGGAPRSLAGSVCEALLENQLKDAIKLGKWIAPIFKSLPPIIRFAAGALDILHASILSLGLDYKRAAGGEQNDGAHYGPSGHAGENGEHRDIVFQVGVRMLLDMPDGVVKCGRLLGLDFPPKGPVEGVPIDWRSGGEFRLLSTYDRLVKHGTVIRADPKTGKNGLAVFIFRTKDEPLPGLGKLRRDHDVLMPTARLFTPFGNILGYLAEQIPPFVPLPWSVSWHQPNGLKFKAHVEGENTGRLHIDYDYEAKVCDASDFYNTQFRGYWRQDRTWVDYPDGGELITHWGVAGPLRVTFFGPDGAGIWHRALTVEWSDTAAPPEFPPSTMPTGDEETYADGSGPLPWSPENPVNFALAGTGNDTLRNIYLLTGPNEIRKVRIEESEVQYERPDGPPTLLPAHDIQVDLTDAPECPEPPAPTP
jgi:hypothetical protein